MKSFIAILLGKLTCVAGKILKRGSSLPGKIALKIDKNVIRKFQLPKNTIVVTGSSGKTSTSYTIAHILRENGYSVAHNFEGSNLSWGITTLLLNNCKINGKSKADAFVIEMDERYSEILKDLKPTYLVICNITRDQPPRQGHFDYVFNIIKSNINDNAHLILNGDDPMTTKFAKNHKGKVTFFGMCKTKYSFNKLTSNSLDMVYCPKCNSKLKYNYVSFSNVGEYHCSNKKCNYKNPNISYKITNFDNDIVTINDKYSFKPTTDQIYNLYNYIAAYSVVALIGVDEEKIALSLENVNYYEKRYSSFDYKNRKGYILSGKNENAPSYNQAINYIKNIKEEKTIIFGFEYISLRYPYEDISWLYDIDFELLTNVKHFICIGPFAYDIAVRINLSGISKDKIIICDKISDVYNLLDKTKGNIYSILNLGTDKRFIKELNNHNILVL